VIAPVARAGQNVLNCTEPLKTALNSKKVRSNCTELKNSSNELN